MVTTCAVRSQEDLVYARLVPFDNVKKVFQYCAHCVPVLGTAVKRVNICHNFQAVVCSIPCNDTTNMPIYSPLPEPLRLFLSIFELQKLHGPVHDNKRRITLEGVQNTLLSFLLVLSSDNVGLPLKYHLLGLLVVVLEVFFLIHAVQTN